MADKRRAEIEEECSSLDTADMDLFPSDPARISAYVDRKVREALEEVFKPQPWSSLTYRCHGCAMKTLPGEEVESEGTDLLGADVVDDARRRARPGGQ